jgi:hypothetical protein
VIAPKVTSYVTPTRHEAPPTTTRIITRVPTADEAREILRGEQVRAFRRVLERSAVPAQCGHRGTHATCTKAHGHVGEHAVHAHGLFGGPILRRWTSEERHDG